MPVRREETDSAGPLGPLILLIFFGMLVFGWFYVFLFIPETKGLSLEEASPATVSEYCFMLLIDVTVFRLMSCIELISNRGNRLGGDHILQRKSINTTMTAARNAMFQNWKQTERRSNGSTKHVLYVVNLDEKLVHTVARTN